MTHSYFKLDLELRLETSVLVASDFSRGRISKLMVRNAAGHPYIPATTLKGRLRFYLQQFGSVLAHFRSDLPQKLDDALLGSAHRPGKLFFEAAVLFKRTDTRSGIMVNRQLGSVEDAHLRTIETCPAQVLRTQIEGEFEGGLKGHELGHLLGALRLFDKLGAGKSNGLGRVRVDILSLQSPQSGESLDPKQILEHYLRRQIGEVPS